MTNKIQLFCGDSIELLNGIPDESVDLIVTDPPYKIISGGVNGTGSDLGGMLSRKLCSVRKGKVFNHNDIKFSQWLPLLYRILKKQSHCYIMINARNIKELQTEAEKTGFRFVNLLAWKKNNKTPNKYYMNQMEFILLLRKGNARNINYMGSSNCVEVSNIIGKKNHPTEKPTELMDIFVRNSSNEGDTILDPFMGSGSVGVSCVKNCRNFIGMEIDNKYFDVAKQRIDDAAFFMQMQ